MQNAKLDYATPSVTKIGTFEEVTQASTVGATSDAAFPAGTPIDIILVNLS